MPLVDVMDAPEPKRSRKTAWIFSAGKGILAGVILVLALVWLSSGTGWSILSPTMQRVFVVFKSAGGLKEGEKVQVAGLEKGKVVGLEIKDIDVRVEGKVRLDKGTLEALYACLDKDQPGEPKVNGIRSIHLVRPKDNELPADKRQWEWAVTVTVAIGNGPNYPEETRSLHLNDDNLVPPNVRQRLVTSWVAEEEFKEALNEADRNTRGDYDTTFTEFEADDEKGPSDVFTVNVQMPQSMVLCTLDLDRDLKLGAAQPYRITLQQTAPLIGKPFVSFEPDPLGTSVIVAKGAEKTNKRKAHLLNLGKQESAGLQDLTKTLKDLQPKLEEAFGDLKETAQKLASVMRKIDQGEGVMSDLMNNRDLRNKFRDAVTNLQDVLEKVNKGQGSLGDIVNKHELHDQIASATKKMDEVLNDIEQGKGTAGKIFKDDKLYNDWAETGDNFRTISARVKDPTNPSLVSRMFNDPKLGDSASKMFEDVSKITTDFQGHGPLKDLLTDREADVSKKLENGLSKFDEIMQKATDNRTPVGKLLVDEKLGKKVEEAVNGAAEAFGAVTRTRVFLGGTSKYYGTSQEWIQKGYVRIAPSEHMFLQVGGADIFVGKNSPVNADPTGSHSLLKVDAQLGYKFFDNHLTLRVGALEGKPGGGVDYDFTVPGWDHDFRATVEARMGISNSKIDEHENVIVHGELSTQIWKYIRIYAGAGNSVDGVDWMGGVTFEWNDDDLKAFVGLLSAAKK